MAALPYASRMRSISRATLSSASSQEIALEPARAARSRPAQRMLQPVGMVDALDLAEAADAGVERRQLGPPLAAGRWRS